MEEGDMTLIDMGTDYEALKKDEIISALMEHSNEGKRLKHIFLTHPDADHYNMGLIGTGTNGKGLLQQLVKEQMIHKVQIHIGKVDYWEQKIASQQLIDYITKGLY